jgi:hypothetical protein
MKAGQGKTETVMRGGQENTDAAMSANRYAETELEETIDKQVEGVLASVNQWTRSLHEEFDCEIQRIRIDIRAVKPLVERTRRGLETQLSEVETQVGHEGGVNIVTDADWAKPLRIDSSISWIVLRYQFEAVAGRRNWASREKGTYVLAVLQGKAADVLQSVPTEMTYEGFIEVLVGY